MGKVDESPVPTPDGAAAIEVEVDAAAGADVATDEARPLLPPPLYIK